MEEVKASFDFKSKRGILAEEYVLLASLKK